ncbi:MAG: hypothetical protein NTW08_07105 [Gammaproteobacteria bacterium]|nr:hypothetical protein [Gammaproteobacteria bacterium]
MYTYETFEQWRAGRELSAIFMDVITRYPQGWEPPCETPRGTLQTFFCRQEIASTEGDQAHTSIIEYRGLYRIDAGMADPIQQAETYTEIAVDADEATSAPMSIQFEYYEQGQAVHMYVLTPRHEYLDLMTASGTIERVAQSHSKHFSSLQMGTMEASRQTYIGPLREWVKSPRGLTFYEFDEAGLNPFGQSFTMSIASDTGQRVDIRMERGTFCLMNDGYFLFSGTQRFYSRLSQRSDALRAMRAAGFVEGMLYEGLPLFFKKEELQFDRKIAGQIYDGNIRRSSYEMSCESECKMGREVGMSLMVDRLMNEHRYAQQEPIQGVNCVFIYAPGRAIQGVMNNDYLEDLFYFIEHIKGSALYQRLLQVVSIADINRVCIAQLRTPRKQPSGVPEVLLSDSKAFSPQLFLDVRQCAPLSLLTVLQAIQQDFQKKAVQGQVADGVAWLRQFFELRVNNQPILRKMLKDEGFTRAFPNVLCEAQAKRLSEEDIQALLTALVPDVSLMLKRILMMNVLRQRVKFTPMVKDVLQFFQQEIAGQLAGSVPAEMLARKTLIDAFFQEMAQDVAALEVAFREQILKQECSGLETLREERKSLRLAIKNEREALRAKEVWQQGQCAALLCVVQQEEGHRASEERSEVFERRDLRKAAEQKERELQPHQGEWSERSVIEAEQATVYSQLRHQLTFFESSNREKMARGQSIRQLVPCLPSAIIEADEVLQPLVLALYRMQLMSFLMKKGICFDAASMKIFLRKAVVERTLSRSGIELRALELNVLTPAVRIAGSAWVFHLGGGTLSSETMTAEMQDCFMPLEWREIKTVDRAVWCGEVFAVYREHGLPVVDARLTPICCSIPEDLRILLREGAEVYIQTLEGPELAVSSKLTMSL